MMGHQLAVKGPDGLTPETGQWLQWQYTQKDDSISSNIPNAKATAVSQENQQSLINFIKNAYKTGKYNPEDGTLYKEMPKEDGLNIIKNPPSSKHPSSLDNEAGDNINTGKVIYSKHYNGFLDALAQFYSPISTDPKGDSLVGNKNGGSGNSNSDGPVCGWPTNADDLVISGQEEPGRSSDFSLIKAELYKGLYDKASKLMYHPYQCNICNIYEGGEWLEIVKELGENIDKQGTKYDNNGSVTASAAGVECTMRTDCSGYVTGCLAIYNAIENGGGNSVYASDLTSDAFKEGGEGIPDGVKSHFTYSSSLPSEPGSILVRWANPKNHNATDKFGNNTEHVEIQGEHGIWSGGGASDGRMMGKMDSGGTTCHFGWSFK